MVRLNLKVTSIYSRDVMILYTCNNKSIGLMLNSHNTLDNARCVLLFSCCNMLIPAL